MLVPKRALYQYWYGAAHYRYWYQFWYRPVPNWKFCSSHPSYSFTMLKVCFSLKLPYYRYSSPKL